MKKLYLCLCCCFIFVGLKAQSKAPINTISLLCHEWKLSKTVDKDRKETKMSPYHEFYVTFTPYEKVKFMVDGKHEEMYWKYFEDGKWIDVNEHNIHTHNIDFTFMKLISVNEKVLVVYMPDEQNSGLKMVYFTKVR